MPHLLHDRRSGRAGLAGLGLLSALALAASLVAGSAVVTASGASAQGFFWDVPSKPRKAKRARPEITDDDEPASKTAVTEKPVSGPLVIAVSLNRQRLVVYDANGPIAESPVSSGRVGYPTPTGVFTILEKNRIHHSNLYGGAPMPNMQRLTWSGVALHAGALPGYPASHGCVRLPPGFSKKLFGMTKVGTRVIVSREPVTPAPFTSDLLFAAYPPEGELTTGSTAAGTKVADASMAVGATPDAGTSVLVSTAAAAETASESPATTLPRLSYRERRQLETERLNLQIRTAGYDKLGKSLALTQTAKAAQAAQAPLVKLRAEADRLEGELAKLTKAKGQAERELADLNTPPKPEKAEKPAKKTKVSKKQKDKNDKKEKLDSPEKIALRKAKLEADIASLTPQIEAATGAWQAAETALTAAMTAAKDADDKRRAAMAEYSDAAAALAQALEKEAAAKKREAKRNLPVSVFISRAKSRLYIRQGWEPIIDVPVTFERPEEPIGTHVFTALSYTPQKTAMNWTVASVPYDAAKAQKKKDKDGKHAKSKGNEPAPAPVALSAQTPQAALERITIPEEIREQIADVMKPGSSLVISDLGVSGETGEYTDIIVNIR